MEAWKLKIDIETLLIENEIMYLVRKYNVSIDHVLEIMDRVGNNRQVIEGYLVKLEKSSGP